MRSPQEDARIKSPLREPSATPSTIASSPVRRVAVLTLGCSLNQAGSETIARQHAFRIVPKARRQSPGGLRNRLTAARLAAPRDCVFEGELL